MDRVGEETRLSRGGDGNFEDSDEGGGGGDGAGATPPLPPLPGRGAGRRPWVRATLPTGARPLRRGGARGGGAEGKGKGIKG